MFHLRVRITTVRLVMEGYIDKEVADLCNLHCQSVKQEDFLSFLQFGAKQCKDKLIAMVVDMLKFIILNSS
jgi:hypothetical protein